MAVSKLAFRQPPRVVSIQSRLWMSSKSATEAVQKKAAEEAAKEKAKKVESETVWRLLSLARPERKNISGMYLPLTHTFLVEETGCRHREKKKKKIATDMVLFV